MKNKINNGKHDRVEHDFLEHLLGCPLLKELYTDFYINKEIMNKSGSMTYCELDLLLFQKLDNGTIRADVFEIKSNYSIKSMYKACNQMWNVSKHWHDIYREIDYPMQSCIEPHYWFVHGFSKQDYHTWKVTNLDKIVEEKTK